MLYALCLALGAVAGGFIARKNSLKAAKTLDELEAVYEKALGDLNAPKG